ncbi:unnamed protein product [Sphagnum jensenii]|uniref:Uncharacterized protein n=1 Tax=Sphagnum jensenii TaxID=128206 RepID=A0ABP0WJ82_9BRYO
MTLLLCLVMLMVLMVCLEQFHQYQVVVGLAVLTATNETQKAFRMKLWATNQVRVKSKFRSSGIEQEEEEDDTFSESFAIEEGIFEDTFPKRQDDYEVKVESNDRPSLVPDDWKPLQEELSRSKWEKKREVIDNLVEHARRKQAQRRLTIAERDVGHKAYQQRHFPRVLPRHGETQPSYGVKKMIEEELYKEIFDTDDDDITQDLLEDETASDSEGDEPVAQINYASSLRATPRNPRLALGDSTFDDVARKFRKQEQDIEENQCDSNSKDNDAESKLLSNKEKAMLRSSNFSNSKVSSEKWNALHTLAASGQINVVDQLLKRGAHIDALDMDGVTALHRAVLTGRESMVRHLLKSGANALATDRVGATALHYAAQTANGNLVRLLTRHGINVNSPDNEGWTPLHVAVQSGRTDIIKLLLRRGADINILNQDGNSPLDIALSFGKGFGFYHVVTSLKKASQNVQGLMQFAVTSEDQS